MQQQHRSPSTYVGGRNITSLPLTCVVFGVYTTVTETSITLWQLWAEQTSNSADLSGPRRKASDADDVWRG